MSTTSGGDEPDGTESRASQARGPFDSAEWQRRLAEARVLREQALARRGKAEGKADPRGNPSQPLLPSGDGRNRTAVSPTSARPKQPAAEAPRQLRPAAASTAGSERRPPRETRGMGGGTPAERRTRSERLRAARTLAPFALGLVVGIGIALPEPVRVLTARLFAIETWLSPQEATAPAPVASTDPVSGGAPHASQLASAGPAVTPDLPRMLATSPAAAIRSPVVPRSESPVHRGDVDVQSATPFDVATPRGSTAEPPKPEAVRTVTPKPQVAAAGAPGPGTDWPGTPGKLSAALPRGDLGRMPLSRPEDTAPQGGGSAPPDPGPTEPTIEPITGAGAPTRLAVALPRYTGVAVQHGDAGDLARALPRDAALRHAVAEPPTAEPVRRTAPDPSVNAAAADPGADWPGHNEIDTRRGQLRGPHPAPPTDFTPRSAATVPWAPSFAASLPRAPFTVVTAARDAAGALPSGIRAVRLEHLDETLTAPLMKAAPRGNRTEPLAPSIADPLRRASFTLATFAPSRDRIWRNSDESAVSRGAMATLAPLPPGGMAPHDPSAEPPARVELRAVAPLGNPSDMADAGAVPRGGGDATRRADVGDFPPAPIRGASPRYGISAPPAPGPARLRHLLTVAASASAPGDVPSDNDAAAVSRSDLGGLPPAPHRNMPSRGAVGEASATVLRHHREISAIAPVAAALRSLPRVRGEDAVRQSNFGSLPAPPARGMAARGSVSEASAPSPTRSGMPGRLAAATATDADPAWAAGDRPAPSGPGAARMDTPAPTAAPTPDAIPPGLRSGSADEAAPDLPVAPSGARIFLHVPSSVVPNEVQSTANHLRRVGFAVNEPVRVDFAVSQTHARYYHEQDAAAATAAAKSLGAAARDFTDYAPSPQVGTIEVWVAGRPAERAATEAARHSAAVQADRRRDVREDQSDGGLLAFLARLRLRAGSKPAEDAGEGSAGSGAQAAAPSGLRTGSSAGSDRGRAPTSVTAEPGSAADQGRSNPGASPRASSERGASSGASAAGRSTGRGTAVGSGRGGSQASRPERSRSAGPGRSQSSRSERSKSDRSQGRGKGRGD